MSDPIDESLMLIDEWLIDWLLIDEPLLIDERLIDEHSLMNTLMITHWWLFIDEPLIDEHSLMLLAVTGVSYPTFLQGGWSMNELSPGQKTALCNTS